MIVSKREYLCIGEERGKLREELGRGVYLPVAWPAWYNQEKLPEVPTPFSPLREGDTRVVLRGLHCHLIRRF